MHNFHVGQKVCAIKDSGADFPIFSGTFYKGDVFTVVGVTERGNLLFSEKRPPGGYRGFNKSYFRPLVSRQTDISVFKEILAGTRQPEGVEA